MESPQQNNAATRLWEFLDFMLNYEVPSPVKTTARTTDRADLFKAVHEYFYPGKRFAPRMHGRRMRLIADVMDLVPSVTADLESRAVQVPPTEILRIPLNRAGKALGLLPDMYRTSLNQFKDTVSATDLVQIWHCAYYTTGVETLQAIDNDVVDRIGRMAQDLLTELLDADTLDETAREYMVIYARKIVDAVMRSKVVGPHVIASAADEAVGYLVRSPELQAAVVNNQSASSGFFDLIRTISVAVSLTAAPVALTADVVDLLSIDAPPSVVIVNTEGSIEVPENGPIAGEIVEDPEVVKPEKSIGVPGN